MELIFPNNSIPPIVNMSLIASMLFFQLEMENDDVIEVYQEQTGGWRIGGGMR